MCKVIWLVLLSVTSASAGLSKLEALGMIETGNNDAAVGGHGEVSRYQIKPWIWKEYSASKAYRDARISSHVAERYLAALEQSFRKRARREPADFDLYVLWNAGPAYYAKCGFSPARIDPIISERARRFVNLRRMNHPPPQKVAARPAPAPAPTVPAPPPRPAAPDLLALLQPLPPLSNSVSLPPHLPYRLPTQLVQSLRAAGNVSGTPGEHGSMLAIGGIR